MQPGALIAGRYRLDAPIGAGAMAHVWRARDERLHRDVAIKVVDLRAASGPVSASQFEREVLATAQLSHPNIVTTFDGGTDGDVAFLVMELLRGESVADRLRRGPLPVAQAARVASEVAKALEATHLIGVVHRDIKPGNVMLTPSGVKVLDFGIARLTGDTDASAPLVIGTAAYMSPEQAGNRAAGPASDVYSLGCLLVALLTGRPPFLGATSVDVAQQQISAVPPSLRALRPDAPPALGTLVARLLSKDAAARPTASEVVAALAPFVSDASDAPTQAFPAPAGTPVVPQGTSVLPSIAGRPPVAPVVGVRPTVAPAPPRGRPGWFRRGIRWIVLGIVLLLAIGAASLAIPRLIGLVTGWPAAAASPSTAKPSKPTTTATSTTKKPTASTTMTMPRPTMPALPTIPMPTMPSLPSAGQAALQAAVDGVTSAFDAWNPADQAETKAKQKLTSQWKKASASILAGKDAQTAVADMTASVAAARDDGSLPTMTYASLRVALQAVALLV